MDARFRGILNRVRVYANQEFLNTKVRTLAVFTRLGLVTSSVPLPRSPERTYSSDVDARVPKLHTYKSSGPGPDRDRWRVAARSHRCERSAERFSPRWGG